MSDFLGVCRELLVVAHLFSVHSVDGLNDRNPGVGLACATEHVTLAAGTYRNSFGRQSAYLVMGGDLLQAGPLALGGVLGVASGYDHVRKLPVIGGLRATLRIGRAEIGALGVPAVGNNIGFVHFTFGFPLR